MKRVEFLGVREPTKTSRAIKYSLLTIIMLLLASYPFWGSEYTISIIILMFLYLSLGQMWNLLGGYSGLVSLGQQAFIGIGGYSVAMLTQVYKMPIFVGAVTSIVVTVIFALVISLPIFKMKGVYFTIGTWIIAEALGIFFINWIFVNSGIGYNITVAYRMNMRYFYYFCFAIGIGSVVIVYLILRSKLGLALMAMRDNEGAAEVRGVKLYRTKLICFIIAACWTAVTGCALYLNLAYIKPPSAFSIEWTVSMVFIVIIGGIGTIEGPIIGTIIYIILRQYLYNFPGISNIILGAIAIIIIIAAPKGIMGYLHDRLGWDFFTVRRRIGKRGAPLENSSK